MATPAKIIITAEDKSKAGIESAKGGFKGLSSASEEIQKKFTELASIAVFVELSKKVAEFAFSCVEEFGTAERAQLRLQAALGDGTAFDKANALIEEMTKKYNGSKDDVEAVVSALAALGKSSDQIEAITKASVNLSNTTGQDLNSSYLLLSDTFEGKISPRLARLLPELKTLTKEQLASGDATEIINKKLSEMSDKIAGGVTQRVRNLGTAFGDLKENIGQDSMNFFSPIIDWLTKVIEKTNDAIAATRLHQKVIREGAKASLQDQIKDKQNQISQVRNERSASLAGSGLNDFSNWLKTQRASSPEMYSGYDSASMRKYNAQFSNQVSEVTKRYDQKMQELQDEIVKLTKELEKTNSLGKKGPAQNSLSPGIKLPYGLGIDVSTFKLGLPTLANVPSGTTTDTKDLGLNSNPFSMLGSFGDKIASVIGVLDGFFAPVMGMITSMSSVTQIMNPLGVIFKGIMDVLQPVIDSILTPILGILTLVGRVIGSFIAPVLMLLYPVIEMITNAFILLYNWGVVPLQNGFVDIIQSIGNFFVTMVNGVIWALNHIPFVHIGYAPSIDLSGAKLHTISSTDVTAAGSSSSTSSGGSGASYTGAQNVTVNIFFDRSYINGDSRAIAIMLRNEIKSAEAMGY